MVLLLKHKTPLFLYPMGLPCALFNHNGLLADLQIRRQLRASQLLFPLKIPFPEGFLSLLRSSQMTVFKIAAYHP
jgi:hypothetical protein